MDAETAAVAVADGDTSQSNTDLRASGPTPSVRSFLLPFVSQDLLPGPLRAISGCPIANGTCPEVAHVLVRDDRAGLASVHRI